MTIATQEDLARVKQEILAQSAPASIQPEVVKFGRWRRGIETDLSQGRLLTGTQHIDGDAIYDGVITANKLEALLVLTTQLIAGAISPADRLTMDATGLKAYGTVVGVANTNTFSVQNNGSFAFGVAPNQVTFVASTGVLTVPAAVITSLTIANVGSGNIGGTYATSSSNPKVELSPTQFRMTNAAGANTVQLDATTGVFTLNGAPSGANRLVIDPNGIEIWKNSTREYYLRTGGSNNAIEMLLTGGSAGQYIGMNPSTGLWLGASTFASGPFRVTPLGALTATSATISGAITATSGSITGNFTVGSNLTVVSPGLIRTAVSGQRVEMDSTGIYGIGAGGTTFQLLNSGAGYIGVGQITWDSVGGVTIGGFTAGTSTLSSGSGGSFVTMSSGATAFSAGGASPAFAPFRVSNSGALVATSATITGAITATSGSFTGAITATSGSLSTLSISGALTIGASGSIVDGDGSSWTQSGITLISNGSFGDAIKWRQGGSDTGSVYATTSAMVVRGDPTSGATVELYPGEVILRYNGTNESLTLQSTNRRALFAGYVHPGTGSAQQTSRYIRDNGSHLGFGGMTTGGINAAWSAGSPVGAAYFVVDINGTNYRVPIWGNS